MRYNLINTYRLALARLKSPGTRHFWSSIAEWYPLTLRGTTLMGAAAATIYFVASPRHDLVALGLCGIVLIVASIAAAYVFSARLLLRNLSPVYCYFEQAVSYSREDVISSIQLPPISLPPLISLRVERIFEHPGARSTTHVVAGKTNSDQLLLRDRLIFPHRGLWTLKALRLEVEDDLGFASLSWQIPMESAVPVYVRPLPIRPLPIIQSGANAGEEHQQAKQRTGDYYDTKPYDASDGVSRIIWKVFARTGELIVRQREPAVMPDGEVAIFLVADASEDHVVGALLDYIRQLRRNDVMVLLGTDLSEAGLEEQVARDDTDIEEHILSGVWSPSAGSGEGFASFTDALHRINPYLSQVVVFSSSQRLPDLQHTVLAAAQSRSISVAAVAVPPQLKGLLPPLPAEAGRENILSIKRLLDWRKTSSSLAYEQQIAAVRKQLSAYGGELLECDALE